MLPKQASPALARLGASAKQAQLLRTDAMAKLSLPVLVCLLSLGACGFEAPAPKRTPPPPTPAPPVSTLAASLRIPAAEIIAALNEKTKAQLAHIKNATVDCLITKCRLDLVATRTGPITGSAEGAGMRLTLPFDVDAHLDMKSSLFSTGGEAHAKGLANGVTQLALKPDWHVEAATDGDVQLSDAKLKLGPLKMSIAELWNHNQEHLSKPLFKALDKHLVSAIKIRAQAERLWQKMLKPIRVGKDPQSWLLLSPQRLRIAPLQSENGSLVIALAADVRARVVVGDPPPAPATPPKLPAPEPLATVSDSFTAAVPVSLSYGDAAKLAMARLEKHPIHAGNMQAKIDRLQVLPSGQDVVVEAHFCAAQPWDFTGIFDSCGDVYLRGVPAFDAKTGAIRIAHMHYDVASENLMLAIMRALAGDALGKALERDFVFDESREIAKLENNIKTAFAKPQGRGVQISGRIESFGPPSLAWTKDGFLALLTAKGTIATNLNLKAGPN
jgi:hypothetical protein